MKIQNIFLKNVGKIVLVLTVLLTTSCGSDDDAATADAFVTLPEPLLTSYTGALNYTSSDGSLPIINTSGTATVALSGNTYTINFSDDVPTISGLVFLQNSNGDFISASAGQSASVISLEDGDLAIGATINGNTWSFSSN